MNIEPIANIRSDFSSKFGIPRQSGLAEKLEALIVFEAPYRVPEALRGIEGFSHLWLIWGFSVNDGKGWSPTVRPPRLGGDKRMGVFATRSPFRPNGLGLSCVRLIGVEQGAEGLRLRVAGADLMDGTPIYDIKPYIAYTDSREASNQGFVQGQEWPLLEVRDPDHLLSVFPPDKREALVQVLAQDPRPAYQDRPERVYGFGFGAFDVRFRVEGSVLTVAQLVRLE